MDKEQKAKEVTEKLQEISQLEELENLVNKNVIEFSFKEQNYRVRKPTQKEKSEANEYRMKCYMEMLKDDRYLFEEQLVEIYKKKGISILDIDHALIENKKKQEDYLLRLAPATTPDDIEKLKEEIESLREEQQSLMFKKNELLQYSIEQQLNDKVFSYSLYLVLEKQVEGSWKRLFNKYDEFLTSEEADNEDILIRATHFLSLLIYNNVA